jgi:hypothetical protein
MLTDMFWVDATGSRSDNSLVHVFALEKSVGRIDKRGRKNSIPVGGREELSMGG